MYRIRSFCLIALLVVPLLLAVLLRRPAAAADAPARERVFTPVASTGLTPLTSLTDNARYKSETGGLYGNGSNDPPAAHLKAAQAETAMIVPRAKDGHADAGGKIVFISIGMSNTSAEFAHFKRLADADQRKSPQVEILDCAQGGKEAAAWSGRDPAHAKGVWETVDNRLLRMDLTDAQVQVAWIKLARAHPAALGDYPAHARELQTDLTTTLVHAKQKWPNLRLVYLSSRIYGGYATSDLNPEPYAYESALAVRALILAQMGGDVHLNYNPARGPVNSPLLLWGPYLWADGVKGRAGDGLTWQHDDFLPDGTHPSPAGTDKVARLLLGFLKSDPTCQPWFVSAAPH